MSLRPAVLRGTLFYGAAQAVSRGGSFLLTVLVARFLGEAGLGAFAALWAAASLLFVAGEWGQGVFITRELARHPDRTEAALAASVRWVGFLSAALALLFCAVTWGTVPELAAGARWLGLALVLQALTSTLRGVFRARGVWSFETLAALADRGVVLGSAVLLLALGGGVETVCLAVFLGQFFGLAVVVFLLKRLDISWRTILAAGPEGSSDLARKGLWLMLAALAAVVYVKSDLILLALFRGAAETGSYAAAYNIILAIGFLPQVALWVLFPDLSREPPERNRRWLKRAWLVMAAMALVVAVAVSAAQERLFIFLYGPFKVSGVLVILLAAEAVNFLNYTAGVAQRAIDRERRLVALMAAGAVLNVLLNLVLIPEFGPKGAAVSTLCAYMVVAYGHAVTIYSPGLTGLGLVTVLAALSLACGYWVGGL